VGGVESLGQAAILSLLTGCYEISGGAVEAIEQLIYIDLLFITNSWIE